MFRKFQIFRMFSRLRPSGALHEKTWSDRGTRHPWHVCAPHYRVLLALVLVGTLVCAGCGGTTAAPVSRPPTTVTVPPDYPPAVVVAATIHLNMPPVSGVSSATGPWFFDTADNLLVQIDPNSNQIVASIPTPADAGDGSFQLVAAAAGAVWVDRRNAGTVQRIDPRSGQVVATIPLQGPATAGIAATPGALWVAAFGRSILMRIDTATNRVVATLAVTSPVGLATSNDALWVCSHDSPDGLWRIDPTTNQVVAKIDVSEGEEGRECGQVRAVDGAVWIDAYVNTDGPPFPPDHLERIDPQTNAVVGSFQLNAQDHLAMAVDVSSLWVILEDNQTLLRANTATSKLIGQTSLDGVASGIFVGGGGLWVQSGDAGGIPSPGNLVWRLTPAS